MEWTKNYTSEKTYKTVPVLWFFSTMMQPLFKETGIIHWVVRGDWASFIGYGHPDRITSQYSEWFLITCTCIYIIFRNCTIKYQNCYWWNVLYYTSQNRVVTLSQTRTLENANSKQWFVFFNVSCWYEYSGYCRKNI